MTTSRCFWRTADKLKFGMCTKRRCSSLVATFRLDPGATGAPALAWSSGRLLIARHRGDALVHETIPLAR